jgi:hypothetical protein
MTFFFEDGEQVDIEGAHAHSFISQDLNWVVQAHGSLIDVAYGRNEATGQATASTPEGLKPAMRKCEILISRAARVCQPETSVRPTRCCI